MDKREEIQRILIDFSEGDIWINKATDDILALFNVVGRSEQLVCDECNFVELQGEIHQCTKCYKVEDRLAN